MNTMPLRRERPDHHGEQQRGAGDDPPGLLHAGRDREVVVVGAVPLLADPGEQEHLVVHRQPEQDGQHQDRVGRVEEALRREAEQAGQVALGEDPGDHAERRGDREQVHHDRLDRQHQRAEGQEQQHQHHRRPRSAPIQGRWAPTESIRSTVSAVRPPTSDRRPTPARPSRRSSTTSWRCLGLAVAVPRRAQQRGVALGGATGWTAMTPSTSRDLARCTPPRRPRRRPGPAGWRSRSRGRTRR